MIENKAKIREVFKSIQGEGPHVGELQVFVRFCGCNLSCKYCDTDFEISKSKEYTSNELLNVIESLGKPIPSIISLTGGEPLLSTKFLKEFLRLAKRKGFKIYLETNATLPDNLLDVLDWIDIVSADIKLPSATGMQFDKENLKRFFALSSDKELFAKIVFDENITSDEINFALELAKEHDFEIILQPMMVGNNMSVSAEFAENILNKFAAKFKKTRLIPQVHKFLNVR